MMERQDAGRAAHGTVDYAERELRVPGIVLWRSAIEAGSARRILPDGCLDLIWDGARLFVAGPDTAARWHDAPSGTTYVGLRCAAGTGPALLGVPADELRDRSPELAALWSDARARRLADRLEADPAAGLAAWAEARACDAPVDPLGPAVLRMATGGRAPAVMSEALGLGARGLHRLCGRLFGYGPRRLVRIVRMGLALDAARAGVPLARVAADCGYADQPHLTREIRALAGATPTELLPEGRSASPRI